jgi:SpoVK/Ycf46/Vps4 family AAA+-type ATPase
MNEYMNCDYNNYFKNPLKIVTYNNFLKKITIKNELLHKINRKGYIPIPSLKKLAIKNQLLHEINRKSCIPIPSLKKTNSPKTFNDVVAENSKLDSPTESGEVIQINIDVEIDSIIDLLNLIEKYKMEPNIHYNINMESLHKIKQPLLELNNMIGMKELKTNVVQQIIYFIQELHTSSHDFMHTVIYGPPGTGKTEIARIMGKIFSNIGLLSKDTFKKVTRSDLIAGYVGQTALKTRDVINNSLGGVLFIDEAYSLGNNKKEDSYSKECIDTICEALSNHKQDLMVIIAGYENELNQCFFNYNQGLQSRFAWRFKTDEYSGKDLHDIFIKKVNDIEWSICENDKGNKITPLWFEKNKSSFKCFGRDIECLLAKTKIAHSKRVFCKDIKYKKKLILEDLDNGLEFFLRNKDLQNSRDDDLIKKQIQYSMYN